MTPAVDPWAGQDTPWDPLQIPVPAPPPVQMPPTRIEAPAAPHTRVEAPAPPPPRVEAPPPPPPPPSAKTTTRGKTAPSYVPPKYAQQVVKGPPPPRRKPRRLRKVGVFLLLSLVFCGGVPAVFLWPAAGQYPVSAQLPASVSDLALRDDAASKRAAARLSTELNDGNAFAGVYGDDNGKRVTIFGITGLRLTPEADVEAQIQQLSTEYALTGVESFDMGETGVHERCGVGKAGRNTVVVCAWADHGSLVTVLLTRRSVADSADLTAVLRSAVLIRG